MAPERGLPEDVEREGTGGEKHGWLSFREYRQIHENALERSNFVEDQTNFERVRQADGSVTYLLTGNLICSNGVLIEVEKRLSTRPGRRQDLEVRGELYFYRAYFRGGHNIIRYANCHGDEEFHRHLYDLNTGEEVDVTIMTREEFPTLIQIVEEVERLASSD